MSPSEELSCRELVELITKYLEGTLPAADRRRFEEHLAHCPGCETYLEQIRVTLRLLGRLAEESLPPRMKGELLRAFRDWKARR